MSRKTDKNASGAWYIYQLKLGSLLAKVYALTFYDDMETVLADQGRIILFRRVSQAESIVQRFASGKGRQCRFGSRRVSLTCDFAELVDFVMCRDGDQDSRLLNGLNTLFELVHATGIEFPKQHKKSLEALADHLTFSDDLAGFFSSSTCPREQVLNVLLWCVGAVCTRHLVV